MSDRNNQQGNQSSHIKTGQGIRSIIRNSSFLIGGHILTLIFRGAFIILLARLLGPEAYGLFNYGLSWYLAFITLTYLGLDIVLGKEIGINRDHGSTLVGATLTLRFVATLLILLISTVAALVFESKPEARSIIFIFSGALLGRAIWIWGVSVFAAFEDTRHSFWFEAIFRPLEILILLIIMLGLNEKNILVLAGAHSILWLFQAGGALILIRNRVTGINFTINRELFKRLLKAGLPGAAYTLTLGWFLQAPIILYRQLSGTGADLGYFVLAIQVIGYLVVIPYFVGTSALPVLSRSNARQDGKDRKLTVLLLLALPLLGLIMALVGEWLIPTLTTLIFGEKFEGAGKFITLAIWLFIPYGLAVLLQQVVFARWNGLLNIVPGVLGIIVMALTFSPFTERLGYRGALLATGIGLTIWFGGLLLLLLGRGFFKNIEHSDRPE